MKILTSLAFGFDLLLLIPLAGAEGIDLQQLILTHVILAKTAFRASPGDYQPALSRVNPKPVFVALSLANRTDQQAILLLSTNYQIALNNGYVNRGGYREDRPIERRYMDGAVSNTANNGNTGNSGDNNHDSNQEYNKGYSPDNNHGNNGNFNHNDNHDYRGGGALN